MPLINFTCANYNNIINPMEFDFFTGTYYGMKNEEFNHTDNLYTNDRMQLYPTTLLFGASNGGKTTVLDAIYTMRQMVVKGAKNYPLTKFKYERKNKKENTHFSISILVDSCRRYKYQFELKNGKVVYEKLEECMWKVKDGQWRFINRGKKVFERKKKAVTIGKTFKKSQFGFGLYDISPDFLLLSCIGEMYDMHIQPVKDVYKFFKESIVYETDKEMYALKKLKEDKEIYKWVIQSLNDLSYNIGKIEVFDDMERFIGVAKRIFKKYGLKAKVQRQNDCLNIPLNATIYYINEKEVYQEIFNNASEGLKSLICLLVQIAESRNKERILLYDNVDMHINPIILEKVLKYTTEVYKYEQERTDKATKKNQMLVGRSLHPQFIFTIQSAPMMRLDLFRIDQLWIVENVQNSKDETQKGIQLYSLAEFKQMENSHANLNGEYMQGKYGGIPVCEDLCDIKIKRRSVFDTI